MTVLRRHLMHRCLLAVWLVVLALLMKMLVPTGYMIGASSGSFTIELCSGYSSVNMAAPMPGMAHHQDKKHHQGKEMPPCAFFGLSAPSLAGADPVLLAIAIAFVILTVFRIAARPALPSAGSYLRPPLRGPPAHD